MSDSKVGKMLTKQTSSYNLYSGYMSMPKFKHVSFRGDDQEFFWDIIQQKQRTHTCAYCGAKMIPHDQAEEELKRLLGLSCEDFKTEIAKMAPSFPEKYQAVLQQIVQSSAEESGIKDGSELAPKISKIDAEIALQGEELKKVDSHLALLRKLDNKLKEQKIDLYDINSQLENQDDLSDFFEDFDLVFKKNAKEKLQSGEKINRINLFLAEYKKIDPLDVQKRYEVASDFLLENAAKLGYSDSHILLNLPVETLDKLCVDFFIERAVKGKREKLVLDKTNVSKAILSEKMEIANKKKLLAQLTIIQKKNAEYIETNSTINLLDQIVRELVENPQSKNDKKLSAGERITSANKYLSKITAKDKAVCSIVKDGRTFQLYKIRDERELELFIANVRAYRNDKRQAAAALEKEIKTSLEMFPKESKYYTIIDRALSLNKLSERLQKAFSRDPKYRTQLDYAKGIAGASDGILKQCKKNLDYQDLEKLSIKVVRLSNAILRSFASASPNSDIATVAAEIKKVSKSILGIIKNEDKSLSAGLNYQRIGELEVKEASLSSQIEALTEQLDTKFKPQKSINSMLLEFIQSLEKKSQEIQHGLGEKTADFERLVQLKRDYEQILDFQTLFKQLSAEDQEAVKIGSLGEMISSDTIVSNYYKEQLSVLADERAKLKRVFAQVRVEMMKMRSQLGEFTGPVRLIFAAIKNSAQKARAGGNLSEAEKFMLGYEKDTPEKLLQTVFKTRTKSFDHIVQAHLGGASDSSNGVICCKDCNSARSNKPLRQFLDEVPSRWKILKGHLKKYGYGSEVYETLKKVGVAIVDHARLP